MTISSGGLDKKLKAGNIYFFEIFCEASFSVKANSIRESLDYSFSVSNGLVNGGNTRSIKLGDNETFIQLLPIDCLSLNNLTSNIYMYDNSPCIVNIFDTTPATLLIQYKNININKKLIKNNYKINIFNKKIKNNSILFICLENSIKKYFLILNGDKIIFNNYLKEININDNLIILDDNINCLGEKTVFEYNPDGEKINRYAVKYKTKNSIDRVEYKFLDAVKVSNKKLMKECLTSELQDTELDYMQEFLGDYDDYIEINNHYILIKNFEAIKSINLEINNNLICNIFD